MKACSCGVEGCPIIASQDGHSWDPLDPPADDCAVCGGTLAAPVGDEPFERPVPWGSSYAHPWCAR